MFFFVALNPFFKKKYSFNVIKIKHSTNLKSKSHKVQIVYCEKYTKCFFFQL